MEIFRKLIILLWCFVFLESNLQSQNTQQYSTIRMEVVFLHPSISTPTIITREDLINDEYCFKSIITDTVKLKSLDSLLNGLQIISEDFSFDNIILCKLYANDGSYKELILGAYSGTLYNGVQMNDNNDLNFFIKNEIGFYDLMELDYINIFRELKNEVYLNNVILNHRKIKKFDCKVNELPSED